MGVFPVVVECGVRIFRSIRVSLSYLETARLLQNHPDGKHSLGLFGQLECFV
jgi:hypothetical protein